MHCVKIDDETIWRHQRGNEKPRYDQGETMVHKEKLEDKKEVKQKL
jgi:hypothetical protein